MDLLSAESVYETYLVFKETLPVNENFAFFGIPDGNFMLNSGSFFAIQAGLLAYYVGQWFVNYICVKFAYNPKARLLGLMVW